MPENRRQASSRSAQSRSASSRQPSSRQASSRSTRQGGAGSRHARGDQQRSRSAQSRAAAGYTSTAATARSRRSSGRRGAPAGSYRQPARRRGVNWTPILAVVLIALIVGGAALILLHPWKYDVNINGTEVTVKRNATIADVIEEGHASPAPGNLLAVDGSLLEENAGDIFAGSVNGTDTNDPETVLKKGDVVIIGDGADATESYQSVEEAIPFGQSASSMESDSYWQASLHVNQKGEDGLKVTKTGDKSGITVTEVTKEPVDAGYTSYTCNPGEDKVIALTFDDGPWPETTDQILDVLEANGAKATFFTIGNQIADYTAQVQREHALGCEVCTHSWDHAAGSGEGVNLTYMSPDEQIQEITKGYEAIKTAIGEEPPRVIRAPGGNYYGDIITTLQPYVDAEVGWDVDTEDWRLPGADSIYSMIMSVQPGQVVLMHDGGGDRSQTVEAVSRAVPELVAQGYKLVTVSDLLAYPPNTGGDSTVATVG